MNHLPTALLFATFSLTPLTAQITSQIETLGSPGVVIEPTSGARIVDNFPTNAVLTGVNNSRTLSRTTPQFAHSSSVTTGLGNRIQFRSNSFVSQGTAFRAAYSTNALDGKPGASRFRVTLTSPTATRARIHWTGGVAGTQPGSRTIVKISGGLNRTLEIQGTGSKRDFHVAIIPLPRRATLDLEFTTFAPLPATSTASSSSSQASIVIEEVKDGTFSTFGKSCAQSTIGATSTPRAGEILTLTLSGVPQPSSIGILLIGFSKERFHFLKLPHDLASAGMPGCDLNVGYSYHAFVPVLTARTARFSFQLPSTSGRFYAQWAEWNFRSREVTMTKGAEITH